MKLLKLVIPLLLLCVSGFAQIDTSRRYVPVPVPQEFYQTVRFNAPVRVFDDTVRLRNADTNSVALLNLQWWVFRRIDDVYKWVPATGSGGVGSVTSVGLESSNGSIAVSPSPITGSGVLDVRLPVTGVVPGTYNAADITVDAFGRVLAASNGSAGAGPYTFNYPLINSSSTITWDPNYIKVLDSATLKVGADTVPLDGNLSFDFPTVPYIDSLAPFSYRLNILKLIKDSAGAYMFPSQHNGQDTTDLVWYNFKDLIFRARSEPWRESLIRIAPDSVYVLGNNGVIIGGRYDTGKVTIRFRGFESANNGDSLPVLNNTGDWIKIGRNQLPYIANQYVVQETKNFWVDSAKAQILRATERIAIGDNPFSSARGQIQAFGSSNSFPNGVISVWRPGVTANGPGISLGSIGGTYASPTAMFNTNSLGAIQMIGSTGGSSGTGPNVFEGARISAEAWGDWSVSNRGTYVIISTADSNATVRRDTYKMGDRFKFIGSKPFSISTVGGTDAGTSEKLQVLGNAIIKSTTTSNVNSVFKLSNSAGTILYNVSDSGQISAPATLAGEGYVKRDSGRFIKGSFADFDELRTVYKILDSSFISQTAGLDLNEVNNNTPLGDAQANIHAIYIPDSVAVKGVRFYMHTQGSFTGDNTNSIALYKYSGGVLTKVAETANDENIWKNTAGSFVSVPFLSTYSAGPGLYYVSALYNNSAQTTQPRIGAASAAVNVAVMGIMKLHAVRGAQSSQSSAMDLPTLSATLNALPYFVLYQ